MRKTFYEFFAGGGMARAGLGPEWECLFANDCDVKKAKTYVANWGDNHFRVADIRELTTAHLPARADLAWASFPCQDLSLAGNRAGLNGNRSGTFWAFSALMQQLKSERRAPRMIVLENVVGALTSKAGADFVAMVSAVVNLGYRVGAVIVDAIHFVPQSRPRLFLVAVDHSLSVLGNESVIKHASEWHTPALIRAHGQLARPIQKHWIWWNLPPASRRVTTLEDLIERIPTGVGWNTQQDTQRLLEMMSPANRRKVVETQQCGRVNVGTVYKRTRNGIQQAEVRFDGVAGCLRTPGGGSSRQTIVTIDGSNVRSRLLSSREAVRLMGLPDSYLIPERYTDAYQLAGDGVVVPVVAYLAKNLLNPLTRLTVSDDRSKQIAA